MVVGCGESFSALSSGLPQALWTLWRLMRVESSELGVDKICHRCILLKVPIGALRGWPPPVGR